MIRPPVPLRPPLPTSVLSRAAAGLAALLLAWAAQAQDAPALRASPQLQEQVPAQQGDELPTFVRGDRIEGETNVRVQVQGHAELRRGDTTIHADQMDYDVPADRARASGDVRINRAGNVYDGTLLDMKVDAFDGFFTEARYRLLENGGHGEATRVDFIDREHSVAHNATYTTCERDDEASWRPDWVLRAKTLHIDKAEDVGTAENAVLEFKGVPLFATPWISFPLSNERKTGLLPPLATLDSVSGLTYAQPWYWNIAPNRDATFTPTVMLRRGVALDSQYRYLEPRYSGELGLNFMPDDKLRERTRWLASVAHRARIGSPMGDLSLSINARRASDNDYWRDFPQRGSNVNPLDTTAQRLLPADGMLSWGSAEHTLSLRTLRWQTLQDVTAPITPPYDLLPQLHWGYTPATPGGGLDLRIDGDLTHFHGDRAYYTQPNAQRSYFIAQISRPWLTPASFITPRLQLHASHYAFDTPLATGQTSASRVLPTFSLDSGLVFERDASYLGRAFVQTLEPRAFYTYTPYRDQSMLPVYDTAQTDFNFASIYTENAFGGNDRIADNNLLTLGATTRLLDPATGAEALRLGIAQRLRFSDQRVTMPGVAVVSERISDVLLGAGIHWTPEWGLDSTFQYNPKTRRSMRTTIAGRYTPSKYHTLSAAYRKQDVTGPYTVPSEQLELGWQWPLDEFWRTRTAAGARAPREAGRLYGVGRLNYSLQDRKFVDAVVGMEYESCCWIGRVVLERLQIGTVTSNTRILLQLELKGLSRLSLGNNPLASLQQNVPGYQVLDSTTPAPSRFTRYD
ncbi:MAG: LPS-assembly protein LptD [Comamonadaceae bacterium]|nr:LPS-assembly protein LptD [Burkholderiales bacterium]MEB2347697.1 LPS-assembly protein LptD [Comamonadaceae bacterium]